MGFLTEDLPAQINFEYQKKLLSYYSCFSAGEIFKEIDTNGNGFISSEELAAYFEGEADFEEFNFDALTKKWNMHGEDKLSFVDFREGLAPYSN